MRRSSSAFPTPGRISSHSSRLSSVRGSRARTRIGGSMSSTILSHRSARHWCERGFRARSSTSIAIQAALRSIPVRRRRNSSQPRPSMANRSIGRAWRPDAADIAERRRLYFDPYHAALAGEIARLRQKHQRVALFDAHSIRSVIPRLFDGELPVFNLGTNSGASCDPRLRETIGAVLAASGQTSVVDGRFKGGWITRAFGRPSEGVEAVQLELACRAYMQRAGPSGARELANADRRKARGADARDDQARPRDDAFGGRQLVMRRPAHCHSRRERSERSEIQRLSCASRRQTLDPRSDLRSAEDDKFL